MFRISSCIEKFDNFSEDIETRRGKDQMPPISIAGLSAVFQYFSFASKYRVSGNNPHLIGHCSLDVRLLTMNPLYPCGKPCSRGTRNETVKKLTLFSAIIKGIIMESQLRTRIPWECYQLLY